MPKKTVAAKDVVARAMKDLSAEALRLQRTAPAVKGTAVKAATPKLQEVPPVMNKDLQVVFSERDALRTLWEGKPVKIGMDVVKGGKIETSNDLTFVLPVALPSGTVLKYKITFEPPAKASKNVAPSMPQKPAPAKDAVKSAPAARAASPVKRAEPVKGAEPTKSAPSNIRGSFGLSQSDEVKMRADWQSLSAAQKARTTPQQFAREWARRNRR